MKTILNLLLLTFCLSLFAGCSKTDAPVISVREQRVKYLVGIGNKVWHLNQVYVNTVQQILTTAQMKFTKTYTIDPSAQFAGSFTNSDGYTGTWRLSTDEDLKEIIVNNQTGPVSVDYVITSMTETTLDMYYVASLKLVREVYNAY